jgi:hypothetical protein
MTRIALVIGLLFLLARPARAQEEVGAAFAYIGLGVATGSALTSAALFTAFDVKVWREGRRPSLTHAVLEVVFSQLHLVAGTALFAFGIDQREPTFGTLGGVMLAVSLPPTIHGAWALSVSQPGTDDRRRRTIGGAVELSIALVELAAVAGAAVGFANDPVDHVQRTGLITVGVIAAVPLALGAHGVYLLATRNRAMKEAPPVTLAPSLLRGGAMVSLVYSR